MEQTSLWKKCSQCGETFFGGIQKDRCDKCIKLYRRGYKAGYEAGYTAGYKDGRK